MAIHRFLRGDGPRDRAPRRRMLAVLGGSLIVGLMLALAFVLAGRDQLLADKLIATLTDAPTGDALRVLAQAERLGPAGIDVLVAGLASREPAVAAAAGEHLGAQVDSWETLAATAAAENLDRLVGQLDRHAAAFSPEARRTAGALATRILLWPEARAMGGGQRVAVCERLLRALHASDRPAAPRSDSTTVTHNEPAHDPAHGFAASLAPTAAASLPGGGLPIMSPRSAPAPRPQAVADRTPPAARIPAQPVSSVVRPRSEALPEPAVVTTIAPPMEDAAPPDALSIVREQLVARLRTAPGELSSFDLCRLTHDTDPAVAESARAELARRQLDPRLIELGRMLTDPDVQTRLAWTEQLTRIAGLDAEAWLVALLDDEAPAVRRAALAILMTVPGRQHAARIAQLAASDPSPEVRDLAASAAKRR